MRELLQVKAQSSCTLPAQAFNVHGDRKDALDLATHYPLIKAIIWFDEKKPEATAADKIVDWQFSNNPDVLKGFVDWVTTPTNSSDAKDIPYWKLLVSPAHQAVLHTAEPHASRASWRHILRTALPISLQSLAPSLCS